MQRRFPFLVWFPTSLLVGIACAPADSGTGFGEDPPTEAHPTGAGGGAVEGSPPDVGGRAAASSTVAASSVAAGGGDCPSANKCGSGIELGDVPADQTAGPVEAHGDAATFYRIHFTEGDTTIFPHDFSFSARLDPQSAASYELFAYDDINCTSSAWGGDPKGIGATWTDTDALDDRWVTLEVRRSAHGPCGPDDSFTLTVTTP